jgi:hypothetical protein
MPLQILVRDMTKRQELPEMEVQEIADCVSLHEHNTYINV